MENATTKTKQRYIVEGVWDDNDGADPITADWIVATSADEAESIVTKVRGSIDSWSHAVTWTFEQHIQSERERLAKMETMTLQEVEDSWADTKEMLHYENDEAGECLTCGTQCDDEGICPICAALEAAQEELRQATPGVIPSAWRSEERERIAKAYEAIAAALNARIESCRKCGKALALRDVVEGDARTDQGEGEEVGNVFVYCSEDCRETH
jgi:hypothetical protein